MKVQNKAAWICIFVLIFFSTACLTGSGVKEIPATALPLVTVETTEISPPAITIANPTSMPSPFPVSDPNMISQWATQAYADPDTNDPAMALGIPDTNGCGRQITAWSDGEPDDSGKEIFLQLQYQTQVLPKMVRVVQNDHPGGIIRVELMNSISGLGRVIYEADPVRNSECPFTQEFSANIDIVIDTIVLTLSRSLTPTAIDAVELIGTIPGFVDLPVFWRVPIPINDPVEIIQQGGIATDSLSNLYLANGREGLHRFDVEGNPWQIFSIPVESNLADVTVDNMDNVVVADTTYQWWVTLDQEGLQIIAGGEEFGWDNPREVAVHPENGNIYLLDQTSDYARIRIYKPDTAEWIQDIDLETGTYTGLAFDRGGVLYTLEVNSATVVKINPVGGDILDQIGYPDLIKTQLRDLALDENGNIYVLLSYSPDNQAVYILDTYGRAIHKFGRLDYKNDLQRPEGSFFEPISIAVTRDGRFVFVYENGYLTCFNLETVWWE